MIGGAGLELGQRAGHGQRKGVHLPDLLPVLLRRAAARVVLVEGVQVIAVHGGAGAVCLGDAPGQHDARLARHQLQLRLLGRRRPLALRGESGGHGRSGEGGQHHAGAPGRRTGGNGPGFYQRILHDGMKKRKVLMGCSSDKMGWK